ncbi:unnamed protein product, partial [Urochloa humidicola]
DPASSARGWQEAAGPGGLNLGQAQNAVDLLNLEGRGARAAVVAGELEVVRLRGSKEGDFAGQAWGKWQSPASTSSLIRIFRK